MNQNQIDHSCDIQLNALKSALLGNTAGKAEDDKNNQASAFLKAVDQMEKNL